MDKNILKKFAMESRSSLMERIEIKLKSLYLNEKFNKEQRGDFVVLSNNNFSLALTKRAYDNRELLINNINKFSLKEVIERAAYTWFNRLVAIRYMEINNYLPLSKNNEDLGIRVLSSIDNTPNPDILRFTNLSNRELDLNIDMEYYSKLEDNEKYEYILLLVCEKLKKVIPNVFGDNTDYIDLLIPGNLLKEEGFINKLVTKIPESNFKSVEIIGWLYQYYNQVEKDRVISARKAYKKNEVPYATQLFTPDWIVKYMVENSLGRYYVENTNNNTLKSNWKYYIESAKQEKEVQKQLDKLKNPNLKLEDITFIDPCSGSGHILVYAFDIFYQIYESRGYNKQDIPKLILENNIYGLDIDDRAGQLSILSLLLKAREYDKDLFNKNIKLNIFSIQESNDINEVYLYDIRSNETNEIIDYVLDVFKDAKEYGSILKVDKKDYQLVIDKIKITNNVFSELYKLEFIPLLKQAILLSKKYDVVVTNPPYMGSRNMNNNLKKYISKHYNNSKVDMFALFMEIDLLKESGYLGMINQHSWMFLSSFEKLRECILLNKTIVNMIHLGPRAFKEISGEVVQTTTFIMKNKNIKNLKGNYIRLIDFSNANLKKIKTLEAINNHDCGYYYETNQANFKKIPGMPIAYWVSEKYNKIFSNPTIGEKANVITGMTIGNNNKYLRLWYEVIYKNINLYKDTIKKVDIEKNKWIPYSKSGYRKNWYGNNINIVDWSQKKQFNRSKTTLQHLYFKEAISWPFITSGKFSAIYLPKGFLWDVAGSPCFVEKKDNFYYILAFMTTKLCNTILFIINPTLNVQAINISQLPLIVCAEHKNKVNNIVTSNISISKTDWDSFETSWDFEVHPLVKYKNNNSLESSYESWKDFANKQFLKLKENEEELNRIFIDIYDLNDELTPDVSDKDITITKIFDSKDEVYDDIKGNRYILFKEDVIKSFLSYFVGCMFGRYSLDEEGLIYAGGTFDKNRYKKFGVDLDNIIPLTEEEYFKDDIISRFKSFLKVIYGSDSVYENLSFIASVIGKRGTESDEDTIRRYFINDFYKDHVKTYKKKPIYWLFESGKQNGFKCLIYMHRYTNDLVARIRVDYLHRMQNIYQSNLKELEVKLDEDLDLRDKKTLEKEVQNLNAKLSELNEYEEKIANIAHQRIDIDLDDGVTVNYAKFVYVNQKGEEDSILSKI
ncbi:MAG: BREX-1 system adenine-specific DNA-methyltransferase PglX [Bacilli bacterium]|jgi:type II restriction/modification system DNA methylase subunit YeeA